MPHPHLRAHSGLQSSPDPHDPVFIRHHTFRIPHQLHPNNPETPAHAISPRAIVRLQIEKDVCYRGYRHDHLHGVGMEWLWRHSVCDGMGIDQGQSDGLLWTNVVGGNCRQLADVGKLLLEKAN